MRVIPTMSSSMLQKNLIYLSLSLQIRGKETLRSLNANIFFLRRFQLVQKYFVSSSFMEISVLIILFVARDNYYSYAYICLCAIYFQFFAKQHSSGNFNIL